MNHHEVRAKDYLLHMIDALDRILKYTAGRTEEEFLSDESVQDAVLRNIGIVGEAAKQLSTLRPSSQRATLRFHSPKSMGCETG